MKKDKKRKKKDKERRKKKAGRAASPRGIEKAREAVTRAQQVLDERLAALARVADGLETSAVERFTALAVGELRDDQLIRDLADLDAVFAAAPDGALPPDVEPFRRLPEAMLRWLQLRFGLTPYLEAGRVLEVPSEKLAGFTLSGDKGDAPSGVLVRLRVLAPGWKRGTQLVVPPRAEMI
jgi:hypothetical protein